MAKYKAPQMQIRGKSELLQVHLLKQVFINVNLKSRIFSVKYLGPQEFQTEGTESIFL